ncbi:MAG: hypothetical protein K6T90_02200 [Leptolyngbyaceae cyanobacterium HOT.MB2.61]|nr:hypothetical protein [Leptolyngbyaceae cyanobacterium HOT.MB2.61]
MSENQGLKEQARANARSILAQSLSFRNMDRAEQLALYKDIVDSQYRDLAERSGQAEQSELASEMSADDEINRDAHRTRFGDRKKDVGDIASSFMDKVDFPGFVRDLVVGVFDANLAANERQMQAYQNLLRKATQSLSQIMDKHVDDTEAMYRLIQSDDQFKGFRIGIPSGRSNRRNRGGGGNDAKQEETKPTLLDPNNKLVNLDDNAIKAKILDMKLAMAKEYRTMLRETLLMGVSRLVVEKGTIKAGVIFDIRSTETTYDESEGYERFDRRDMSMREESSHFRTGFWGLGGGYSNRRGESRISIKSGDSSAYATTDSTTNVSGNITGSVEIQFKSDYFKLDNFAQLFDLGQGQLAQGPPQTPPQQLPAADQANAPQATP